MVHSWTSFTKVGLLLNLIFEAGSFFWIYRHLAREGVLSLIFCEISELYHWKLDGGPPDFLLFHQSPARLCSKSE